MTSVPLQSPKQKLCIWYLFTNHYTSFTPKNHLSDVKSKAIRRGTRYSPRVTSSMLLGMIALRRFVQASLSPHPSCIYLACQKFVHEFSSGVAVEGREKGTELYGDGEVTSGCKQTTRNRKQSSSVRRKNLDTPSVQASFYEDNDISKHKENMQDLVKKLKLLQKGSKGTRRQYIMDRNIAETLVTYLKRDLEESDIIVEFSPGLGILTETLLSETTNTVIAYEPSNKLKSNLEKALLPQYSPRLQIQSHDFHKFYGYYIVNQKEPDKTLLHDFLSPMLRRVGTDYSPVKILGVIYDIRFMKRLVYSFTFQCCLYENISPDLYICIPYKVYSKIHHGPNHAYRDISLVFQYYFDLETLHVVPKEGFYPVYTKSKTKNENEDGIYLVKISPKKCFFDKVPRRELESFHFFIHTMSRIRKADSLIIGMERWIPDCGPEIIKHGIHVFAHPRELTPEQLFLAYKIFTSLPSYQESIFHYQRQQFIARVAEKTDVEIEDKASDEILDLEDHTFLET